MIRLRMQTPDGRVAPKMVSLKILRAHENCPKVRGMRIDPELARVFSLDEVSTWFDMCPHWSRVDESGMGPDRRMVGGEVYQGGERIAVILAYQESQRYRESESMDEWARTDK
jgi:hypothetical protein